MRILAEIALRNLIQARRRSALLSTAIGIVTALLVLLLSLGAGIEDNLVKAATMLGGGHVTVAGFYKPTYSSSAPMLEDHDSVRAVVEANTPNLDYILRRDRGWVKVISPAGSLQSGLVGIVPEDEWRMLEQFQVVEGDPKAIDGHNTAIVFKSQADKLNVHAGDVITFQTDPSYGFVNTLDATVVAIVRDVGMLSGWSLFVPRQVTLELNDNADTTTGALWVYVKDIDDAPQTMEKLRGDLKDAGFEIMDHMSAPFFFKFDIVNGEDWVGQKLDLTIWKDDVSFLLWVITAFNTVTWFLVVILVSIIGVGIMNALWSSVRERTREIGTMRAIGMTRRRVLLMIVFEALFLGLFATTAGAFLGAGVALGVDAMNIPLTSSAMQIILASDTLHLVVKPLQVLSAIVFLSLFTGLVALVPARRAAKLPPITAIQIVE